MTRPDASSTPPGAGSAASSHDGGAHGADGARSRQGARRGPRGGEAWLAAVLCGLGALLVLWPALVGGRSTLAFDPGHPAYPAPWASAQAERPPINPITSDIDFFVLPGLLRLRQLEEAGAAGPWWDSAQLLGVPLGANLPFPFLDPLTWLFGGAGAVSALDGLLWLHTALAAWLAWRAVRWLGGSGAAAALAAVGFALGAWMTTRWHLPQIAWTTAFFPGLVTVVERLRHGARAGAAAEGAVWIGLGLVSGFPQAGVLFGLGFVLLVLGDRQLRTPGVLAASAAAGLLGLALAAPQLQALASVHGDSARASAASRAATAETGLAPGALWGAVLPGFFGWPPDFAKAEPPAERMQDWLPQRLFLDDDVQENPVENALDPGLLVLLLGLCALRRGADPRARRLAWLAVGAVLVAIVLPHVVRVWPALSVLGTSSIKRVLVLSAGAWPLAAALEFDAVRAGRAGGRLIALGSALGLLLLGALALTWLVDDPQADAWRAALAGDVATRAAVLVLGLGALLAHGRGRAWGGALAVLVLAGDLGLSARRFNPFPPQGEPFPPTASLQWLGQRDGRVAVLGSEWLLPPPAAALHGLRSVHGVAPLLARRTAELLGCVEGPLVDVRDPRVVRPFRERASIDHPLLDLLQVRTLVHADPALAGELGRANAYENAAEGLAALDRPGAGPRAFVSGGVRVLPERAARLAELARRDRDPFGSTVVEQPVALELPERGAWVPAEVLEDIPGRVRLRSDAAFDGVLVLSESWAPGWRVELDGAPAEAFVADHALLGVALTAGPHELVLAYEPPLGAGVRGVSGAAAALVLLLGLAGWRRARQLSASATR